MSSVDTKDKLCLLWLIKNAWVDNPMILSHTYKNYMRSCCMLGTVQHKNVPMLYR